MSPSISCVLVLNIPVEQGTPDGWVAWADIRAAARTWTPIPSGAVVRLRFGRATYAPSDQLRWLATHIADAKSVQIEGKHAELVAQVAQELSAAYRLEVVA